MNQSILAEIVEGGTADANIRAAAAERISDPAVARRLVATLLRRLPQFDEPSQTDVEVLAGLVSPGLIKNQSAMSRALTRRCLSAKFKYCSQS